jgi:hypothetical protein
MMEVDDWVVVKEGEITNRSGVSGRLGKITARTADGQRYRVELLGWHGPIIWFHHSQIEPHLAELEGPK